MHTADLSWVATAMKGNILNMLNLSAAATCLEGHFVLPLEVVSQDRLFHLFHVSCFNDSSLMLLLLQAGTVSRRLILCWGRAATRVSFPPRSAKPSSWLATRARRLRSATQSISARNRKMATIASTTITMETTMLCFRTLHPITSAVLITSLIMVHITMPTMDITRTTARTITRTPATITTITNTPDVCVVQPQWTVRSSRSPI